MDTPPLLYKSVHVTFVFWVPKTPPYPIHVRHFCVSPPPPPPPPPPAAARFTHDYLKNFNLDNKNLYSPTVLSNHPETFRICSLDQNKENYFPDF